MDVCLSVNVEVPEILNFDHHRMMQILINTICNATKFTDRGHVKVFVDFVEGTEIKPEHMKQKYGRSLMTIDDEEFVTESALEEEYAENPRQKNEYNITSNSGYSHMGDEIFNIKSFENIQKSLFILDKSSVS